MICGVTHPNSSASSPSRAVDEPGVSDLLSVSKAIAILDAEPVEAQTCEMHLSEAHGLVLAQDVQADRDYPPFDKSLMDGYAVRAQDVTCVPVRLKVVGEIPAGTWPTRAVGAGEAMGIMTGAPLPDGADAVVPVEHVEVVAHVEHVEAVGHVEHVEAVEHVEHVEHVERIEAVKHVEAVNRSRSNCPVRILHTTAVGRNIARRGRVCPAGHVVLTCGTKLTAASIAVAASVGAARVRVFLRPRVVVLGTGDEIVPIDTPPGPAQIRNSNNPMLVALLSRLGCDVVDAGVIPDDPRKIRDALHHALTTRQVVFITGGMSMGEYDYVPRVLLELGVELKITKLRIKPGKPFVFGVKRNAEAGSAFVFGLPGNPVSGFACTLRLASRLLARLGGGAVEEDWIEGTLTEPLGANGPREFYQPVVRVGSRITPLKWKGSADVYTLARANALMVRPENEPALPVGSTVRVMPIPM